VNRSPFGLKIFISRTEPVVTVSPAKVLDLVAAGFNPSLVTSAVVPRSAAADALAHPPMKLVIDCTR